MTSMARKKKKKLAKWLSYLYHSHHAIIANRVSANGEVTGWIATGDPVNSIPVGGMRLVGIYHRQVSHHNINPVLRNLTGELQGS